MPKDKRFRLTFLGAAQTVTGSMHCLVSMIASSFEPEYSTEYGCCQWGGAHLRFGAYVEP